MRAFVFASRNTKEILRDPLNLLFGIGFPLVLLFLLSAIQANAPVELFDLQRLTPGITVFGLSFMTLFSATMIAKDRSSLLLERLYTTPMTAADFIVGYTVPIVPLAVLQCVICYTVAILLGLKMTIHIVWAIVCIVPISFLYVALGLLCGSVLTDKQVGGICGALLTNLSAWLSGVWFDLELVGGYFKKIAELLPFYHAAELEKALFMGDFAAAAEHLLPVAVYSILATAAAVFCFLRQMKQQ